jgi:hypothetical protein
MTGRNPDGTQDFPSRLLRRRLRPQRLNTAIGAHEDFLDRSAAPATSASTPR